MTHATVVQGPPDPQLDWSTFPRHAVVGVVYRVCRKPYGPGWFSGDGSGRFDLTSPDGTCYLASEWEYALLEVIGGEMTGGAIAQEFLNERTLAAVRLIGTDLADTTHAKSAAFGVTAQLATMVPYNIPQAWAAHFLALGWEGIRYKLRFDPSGASVGIALFGPGGANSLDVVSEEEFGSAHRKVLWETFGIRVLPVPQLADLELVT